MLLLISDNKNLHMDFETFIKKLEKPFIKLEKKNWTEAQSGNFSCRCSLTDDKFYIVKKEILHKNPFKYLQGEKLLISKKGADLNNYSEMITRGIALIEFYEDHYLIKSMDENLNISSEFYSHFLLQNQLIKTKSEKKFILHVHPDEFIAVSHIEYLSSSEKLTDLIFSILPESKLHLSEGIMMVPYHQPGSIALAEASLRNFTGQDIIIWQKHGILALAEDMDQAINKIETGVKALKIYFLLCSAGNRNFF